MALVVGENTWVTIEEADAYLTNRIGSGPWFDLEDTPANPGDPSKETYLIMAFNILVNKPGYCLDSSLADTNVKDAQAEMAFQLLENYDSWLANSDAGSRGVQSFSLSKWSETYWTDWTADAPLPTFVSFFLSDYRVSNTTVNLKRD